MFRLVLILAAAASTAAIDNASSLEVITNASVASTCGYSATCTVSSVEGVCVDTSAGCCTGGTATAGLCPGASSIQCCVEPTCVTPYGTGTCQTSSSCSGSSYSGYCAGPSDVQCCVSGSSPTPVPPTPSPGGSQTGVDVSAAVSSTTAACFKSSGLGFIIPRAWKSTGAVDTNACTTLNNALSAGIATRDIYMFPCPTCSSGAAAQVSSMLSYITSTCSNAWSKRVWLDIEGSQYWTGSTTSNQAWYKGLVDACTASGYTCGVYSSKSQWEAIFGSSTFSYGSSLPLWYAHYDSNPSFSDYSTYSFGGWANPTAKQYNGDVTLCSFDVDLDYAVF